MTGHWRTNPRSVRTEDGTLAVQYITCSAQDDAPDSTGHLCLTATVHDAKGTPVIYVAAEEMKDLTLENILTFMHRFEQQNPEPPPANWPLTLRTYNSYAHYAGHPHWSIMQTRAAQAAQRRLKSKSTRQRLKLKGPKT